MSEGPGKDELLAEARALFKDGVELWGEGRHVEAVEPLEEAGKLFASLGRDGAVGSCQFISAISLAALGRYEEAIEGYDIALEVYERHGQEIDAATCRVFKGNALSEIGRYEEALADCDVALPVFERHGSEIDAARCREYRANALSGLGRYEEAIRGYDDAEPVFRKHELEDDAAGCGMNRASALLDLGRFEKAIDGYDEALAIYEKHEQELDVALCGMNRASALSGLRRYEEAIKGYDEALAIYEKHEHDLDAAVCRLNRASALGELGRYDEAIEGCEAAEPVFAKYKQEISLASCRLNRANALQYLGRYEEAIKGYAQALPVFERYGQQATLTRCLSVRARSLLSLSRRPEARASLRAACEALEAALARVGEREETVAGLREALPDPFLPYVALLVEDAAEAVMEGREEEAAALREEAFLFSERARSAKLREELGRRLVADVELDSPAPKLLERWRALQRELALLDRRRGAAGSRGGAALEAELEDQAQRLAEVLAELTALGRELYRRDPETAGLFTGELPSLAELKEALGPQEGLVCYLTGDGDDLLCLCLDREGVGAAAALPGGERLTGLLKQLAELVAAAEEEAFTTSQPPDGEAWQEVLGGLGELLLELPVTLGWTAGSKERLTFVPSGPLHGLPFAALGLSGEKTYTPLVARCEVGVSLQAFTRLYQRGKGEGVEGQALALLDPDGSLPWTDKERKALERVFPKGAKVHDRPLTAEEALAMMANRPQTHLSCHARFADGDPWASRFLFAGKDGDPASYLTALQLLAVPRGHQRLFFAAACEGGRSALLAGDEPLGLARGLLSRAAQVVAPQWLVGNAASIDLAASFYAAYAGDAVSALAAAQRAFLAGSQGDPDPELHRRAEYDEPAHPFWWAGFQALG